MRLTRVCGNTGAVETAEKLVGKDPVRYFMPQQVKNLANSRAHALTTGPEIREDTKGE